MFLSRGRAGGPAPLSLNRGCTSLSPRLAPTSPFSVRVPGLAPPACAAPTVPWPTPACLAVAVSVDSEHREPSRGRRQQKRSPPSLSQRVLCEPRAVGRQPLPCDAHEMRFPRPPPASSSRALHFTCSRRRGDPRGRPLSLSLQPAEGIGQGQEAVGGDLGLGPDQPERLHGVLVVRDL